MDIRKLGGLGCGQMGSGIAQVSPSQVIASDSSKQMLEKRLMRGQTMSDKSSFNFYIESHNKPCHVQISTSVPMSLTSDL